MALSALDQARQHFNLIQQKGFASKDPWGELKNKVNQFLPHPKTQTFQQQPKSFSSIRQKLDQAFPLVEHAVQQAEDFYQKNITPVVRQVANQSLFQVPGIGFQSKNPTPTVRQTVDTILPNFERSTVGQAIKGNFTQIPQAYKQDIARGSNALSLQSPESVQTVLSGMVGGPGVATWSKQQLNLVKGGILNNPQVKNILGRFSEITETNPNINKKSLGQLGEYVHSLAETIFGKSAANLTNKQIKNAFDNIMQTADRGNVKAPFSVGLSIDELRRSGKNLFSNVRQIDNPLINKGGFEALKKYDVANPAFQDEIKNIQRAIEPPFQTPVQKKVNIFNYLSTPENVMKKIGLGKEAQFLRKQHEAYLKELPQELNRVTGWIKRVPDPTSSTRIFQYLDGQGVKLNGEELTVANEIKDYLANWADRLKLPVDKRVSHYVTHLFEKDFVQKEFDEDLAKIITNKVPGEVYDPFLQKRLGKLGYKEDVWTALDAYIKRATRKVNYDPALKIIEDKSQDLELSQLNYVKRYLSGINMRPAEIESLIDNFIKTTPVGYKATQRPVTFLSQKIRSLAYKGGLGLNPASAIRNIGQGINTYSILGEKYTPIGYLKLLTRGTKELYEQGVLDDSFIQDRNLSVYKSLIGKIDDGLLSLFNLAEKINRGSAYYGAKSKALSQGMDEQKAIEYAKDIVRKTQFSFGRIDSPVALQSDIAKTIFQFGTYPIKQSEFLINMVKNKDLAGILRWSAATAVYAYGLQKLFGIKYDILPQLSTSPVVQTTGNLSNAMFGDEETRQQALKSLPKSLLTYVPGGVQAGKTLEALKTIREGGSFTPSGRFRFNSPNTLPEKVRSLMFGVWSTKEAQNYLSKRQRLNTPESQQAKDIAKEDTRQRAEVVKIATKMHSQLKDLSPDDQIALREQWRQQGLWTDEIKTKLKSFAKQERISKASFFAQAFKSLTTNTARAMYFKKYLKNKTPDERRKYIEELQSIGLFTDKFQEQLNKLKKANE